MEKIKPASKYGLKDFEDLSTSTSTIMIYSNVFFDPLYFFKHLQITMIDPPLTKKNEVDKDKLKAPYGAIVSVQSKSKIRGLNLRKRKKHWCTVCQPTREKYDKKNEKNIMIKVSTIIEEFHVTYDKWGVPITDIIYYCKKCRKAYKPQEQKKISHFLNQITIVMSLGKKDAPPLNIMLFKNSFKIAGCKNREDAAEAILVLWQDYMCKLEKGWSFAKGAKNPKFVFETVMRNVGFRLGFAIERPALNLLMNSEKYKDYVFMSQYETSAHTNVNIKMHSVRPKDFKYDCLAIPFDGSPPYYTYVSEIPYKIDKEKKKHKIQGKYTTFIVFSSSEIILSGKYDENMEQMYNFFVSTAFTNKKKIEERLNRPDEEAIRKLKRL